MKVKTVETKSFTLRYASIQHGGICEHAKPLTWREGQEMKKKLAALGIKSELRTGKPRPPQHFSLD